MDWEFYVLNFIRDNFSGSILDFIATTLGFLGRGPIYIVILILAFIFRRSRPFARSLSASFILSLTCCNLIIKNIVGRIRPYDLNTTISLIVKAEHDYSFPSAHTVLAFVMATTVFIYNKPLGAVAYIFAVVMGLSRLYLYVHFPTDVICGMVFGILLAIAGHYIVGLLFPDKSRLSPHKEETT